MKNWLRKILILAALLTAMLSAAAYAQTAEEFALTCSTKTGGETVTYLVQEGVYTECGVLAADTYVRCTGTEAEGPGAKKNEKIQYAECLVYGEAGLETVWVKAEALVPAWTLVYFEDGGYVKLHDLIVYDAEALAAYCNQYFPGRAYSFNVFAPAFEGDAEIMKEWMVAQYGEGNGALPVKLVTLGLQYSVVATRDEELTVPTEYLDFDGDTSVKHRVGAVLAPRTGEASLRDQATGSAKVIKMCKAGRLVAVLETGSTYSKIRYDGVEGYIRTDCLAYPEKTANPLGEGIIHVKGATDGKTRVAARCTASTSSVMVSEWATGTSVKVYTKQGSWYAVEKDGWFGYVQQQYLTIQEPADRE